MSYELPWRIESRPTPEYTWEEAVKLASLEEACQLANDCNQMAREQAAHLGITPQFRVRAA